MKRKRLLSWLLVFSIVFTMVGLQPYTACAVTADSNVLGGQTTAGCLKVTVSNGNIYVERYDGSTFVRQYYAPADAVLDVNGALYNLGTYFSTGNRLSVTTQTGDSQSIITTWDTSSMQIIQTVTLPSPTAQYIKLQWSVKNTGSTAMTNLHFLRGEDTYLSGGDNGSGYWDASTNSIGVSKVISGVTQRLYMQGITIPNSYISANYGTMGMDVRNGGELSKQIDPNVSTDNGYAMEWKNTSLSSGATWTIKAIESFISSAVTASGSSATINSVSGSAITLDYTVVNSSTTAQAVTYSISKPAGWTAEPDKTSETLAAGATSTVHVSVIPPSDAANGTYDIILNIAAPGSEAQSISTLTILRTPAAPNVTADDVNNVLVGANDTMEFSIDGGSTWTPYNGSNLPNLTGNVTVQIRVMAGAGAPVGNITTVIFTGTAAADDANNVLVNADSTMEYSTNGGVTWIIYDPGNVPTFSGGTTVLIRKRAGEAVNINFAAYSVTGSAISVVSGTAISVTGSAVSVSGSAISGSAIVVDYANHQMAATDASMEYSTDNGVTWNDCGTADILTLSEDASVLVRKKAGSITTIHFTENPVIPAAPSVTANDLNNTITGANNSMEYSTDGGSTWTAYLNSNPPVFNGNKFVKVRVKAGEAVAINYAADTVVGSAIQVVTGSAITVSGIFVRADFTSNKLIGAYDTMQYSTDNGATWTNCGSSSEIVFSADAIVLLRARAGSASTINFTINPAAAPSVTADDDANKLVGADGTMEYSLDNGTTWFSYNTTNPPSFGGTLTVMVRVKANGGNPTSEVKTLHFVQNGTASDNNGGTKPDNKPADQTVRKVEAGTISGIVAPVEIVRTKDSNKAVDTVIVDNDIVTETLKNNKTTNNTVTVYVSPDKEKPADEVKVNVKADSLKKLSDTDTSLDIMTDDVTITLSSDAVKKLSDKADDLYFRVVPVKDEDQKQTAIENTMSSATVKLYAQYKDIEVYGTPMTIETNYRDQDTTVTFSLKGVSLPTDPELRDKVLANLAVYVQHSDGDKEIIPGTIVYDSTGKPVGVQIKITKFSTFTLISTINSSPVVSGLKINGIAKPGKVLKVSYLYKDEDKDKEGKTTYQWFRADNASGKNKTKITAAIKKSYTVTKKDQGKYLICEVTPVAKSGVNKGKSQFALTQVTVSNTVKKTTKLVDNEKAAKYTAQVKLGLIGSKKYANQVAGVLKNTYHAGNVEVKEEGSYYRVSAEFTNKTEAGRICEEMKKANLIVNYYLK
jgi:NPCBM-associated, NEW3 domain of alpha-galactosidase./BNR/Asp-box repeat.